MESMVRTGSMHGVGIRLQGWGHFRRSRISALSNFQAPATLQTQSDQDTGPFGAGSDAKRLAILAVKHIQHLEHIRCRLL